MYSYRNEFLKNLAWQKILGKVFLINIFLCLHERECKIQAANAFVQNVYAPRKHFLHVFGFVL